MNAPKHSGDEKALAFPTHSRRWLFFGLATVLVLAAVTAVLLSLDKRAAKPIVDSHSHHPSSSQVSLAASPEADSLVGIKSTPAPGLGPDTMIWIPGGTFWMGCDSCDMPDAQPLHLVSVDGFWMDRTPVTNAQFQQFITTTGYITLAERKPDPKEYPGVDPKLLVPGSAVFTPPSRDVPLDDVHQWWRYVPGACWKHPEGPASTIQAREDHPVVHIAWEDAAAYSRWAGKRLPTEAEFEYAARGGLDRNLYAWGNDLKPGGKWAANIWQGRFPSENLNEDGYLRTSPVTAFPTNGFGLYDVGGNVWQWCADWYRADYFATLAAQAVAQNPQGPSDSYDPQEPGVPKRVQKSGSFLCSDLYCSRYLVGSRGRGAVDSAGSNTGFRCVKSAG